ncbi:MAG: ATP-binding protein [Lachnospiraceae bacterium]|nr:ATP-binding protein [Lachnospiraceae bacterium]
MNEIISRFILYTDRGREDILTRLSDIIRCAKEGSEDCDVLRTRAFSQIKELLILATDYGFDEDLWANYITYRIITDENPFSLTAEKAGRREGSVNLLAESDFTAFYQLMHYDFKWLDELLGMNCFSILRSYKAVIKPEEMYNRNVSEKVRTLSSKLMASADVQEFSDHVMDFYRDYGVGMFGLNKAFRFRSDGEKITFLPVNNMQQVSMDDLIGYEIQKEKLLQNTRAFVSGQKANNCLLFGDSGTGKSTCIKAVVNKFYPDGLRMIEIYKHQFRDLSNIIAGIKNRNYKFIIYMDDLSFEEDETEYKFLKAVIEGGVETKPDNILIYATSNRRHLIKETWGDRADVSVEQGIHKSDNMEEKLSLANRFGVTISFSKPSRQEYFDIAIALCRRNGIDLPEDVIRMEANKWELSHGGVSGRTAEQFAKHMIVFKDNTH